MRKKKTEFDLKARKTIKERDEDCIFCKMGYRLPKSTPQGYQIMHFIGRGRGGIGTPENGAVGCLYHHGMYDNGLYHEEMKELFRDYLIEHYPDWDEKSLIYNKWAGFAIS